MMSCWTGLFPKSDKQTQRKKWQQRDDERYTIVRYDESPIQKSTQFYCTMNGSDHYFNYDFESTQWFAHNRGVRIFIDFVIIFIFFSVFCIFISHSRLHSRLHQLYPSYLHYQFMLRWWLVLGRIYSSFKCPATASICDLGAGPSASTVLDPAAIYLREAV